ncbi:MULTISPECIES: acyltransferase family protein [unclassified Curtobacterium]|uniref:acyltransferase family protein n=1 Tax=unclassified Curtobacterium TaxID=257496 RepID=UPI0015E8A7B7|nr:MULTISPECIES: acyltransferase family protein [unclassified Curtobacterium]
MFLHLTADPLRRRRSTRPELQGVRAVAAALVLAFHADVPGLDGGFLGVDVFLVLSGYVVTTMLLAEHRRSGAIDLVAFTRARFSRLAPTAVVVALSTFVVALLAASPLARPQLVPEATAAVFGYENLLLAVRGVDYLQDDTVSAFRQFWSLGLEVQFYAVWPVVLVLALRFAERRGAIWVTGFGLVVSLASVPMARAVAEPFAFFMLPSRAWEFLAGALLAVGPAFAFAPAVTAVVRVAGLLLVAAGVALAGPETVQPGLLTLLPVLGTMTLLLPGTSARFDVVRRLLSTRPMVVLGDASYSIYLWHWPLLALPVLVRGAPTPWPFRLVLLVATVSVGLGSAAVLERRARRFLERCRPRTTSLLAVAAVATLVVPSAVAVSARTSSDVRVAGPDAARIAPRPSAPDVVPANVTPALTDALRDLPFPYSAHCVANLLDPPAEPCVIEPRRTRRVALVGDSHAMQWADVVRRAARDARVGLTVHGRAACPFADIRVVNPQLGREYRECDAWRRETLASIRAEHPEVVVVGEATALYRGRQVGDGPFERVWRDGVRRSLAALRPGTRVVFVQDTPSWPSDPNECLASHLEAVDRCAHPSGVLLDADVRRWVSGLAPSVTVIDPVPALCSHSCSPVLWNVLVYRDRSHLTAVAARTRRARSRATRSHISAVIF